MIPVSIKIENWMCFRGKHELQLRGDVYAIVASRETDPESSNWAGKSSLVAIVPFALYGVKPEQCRLEDDWITRGEKSGSVTITLSDGTVIERTRKRRSSTKLKVSFRSDARSVGKGGSKRRAASGNAAQAKIIELVGLSESDFFATCFCPQKKMSRFVTCQPADRMAIIGEWLDLDPLQRCNANVVARLDELLEQDAEYARRIDVLKESLRGLLLNVEVPEGQAPTEAVSRQVDKLEATANAKRKQAQDLQEEVDNHADWIVTAQTAEDYEGLVVEGKQLLKQLKAMKPVEIEARLAAAVEKTAEASKVLGAAEDRLKEATRNAAGRFDGTCPVVGTECPVAREIKSRAASDKAVVSNARESHLGAQQDFNKAGLAMIKLRNQLDDAKKLNTQLIELRKRATVMKPAWDEIQRDGSPPDISEQREQLGAAHDASNAAQVALLDAQQTLKRLEDLNLEIGAAEDSRRLLSAKVSTHREALAIFGRRGAQRVRAEGSLAIIEAGANACLSRSAGIDLSVEVQWSREAASGLAKTCEACGEPFPKSQRVKECEACGEVRGPKRIEKPELELSDSSGAADDLVGIAFQLGASSYLRRERGSRWGAAIIDEPFSALDVSNRRRFARRLAPMLQSTFGFEQALVITHDQAVVSALPARVEIVAGEMGSRLV
jgi:DNA repair exonuclease SbcCD ATPase subunit